MGLNLSGSTKFIKKLDPLLGGDAILDKMGLPTMLGAKHGMLTQSERDAKAAKKLRAEDMAMQAQQDAAYADAQRLQQQNLQDSRVDMGLENVTNVLEGAASDQAAEERKKQQQRKSGAMSISRSLGL